MNINFDLHFAPGTVKSLTLKGKDFLDRFDWLQRALFVGRQTICHTATEFGLHVSFETATERDILTNQNLRTI